MLRISESLRGCYLRGFRLVVDTLRFFPLSRSVQNRLTIFGDFSSSAVYLVHDRPGFLHRFDLNQLLLPGRGRLLISMGFLDGISRLLFLLL